VHQLDGPATRCSGARRGYLQLLRPLSASLPCPALPLPSRLLLLAVDASATDCSMWSIVATRIIPSTRRAMNVPRLEVDELIAKREEDERGRGRRERRKRERRERRVGDTQGGERQQAKRSV